MSCCCTLATATETVRGPAACACCCLDSPLVQPERDTQIRPNATAETRQRRRCADIGRSRTEVGSKIFTVVIRCTFPQTRRTCDLLDVFILDSVAASPH